ncbi:hypothetical protein JCM5296_001601 [Sporobolomyces johnsonii]
MAHLGPSHQPFTRSRTNLFLSYRDSAVRPTSSAYSRYTPYAEDDDQAESAGLLVGEDDSGDGLLSRRGSAMSMSARTRGGAGKLPPKWVDLQEKVDEIVERVRPKIAQLDKLHSKHLLPGFKDRTAEEREIQALATSITSDFRTCQAHIRKIAEQSKSLLALRPTDPVDAESKRLDLIMAANVQTALATKVQELSTTFRKKQSEYLRLLKGNEARATALQSRSAEDPLASLAEDEQYSRSVLSPTTASLAQQQLFSPSTSTSAIDRRDAEIHAIAQSITDLADLFKDLSSLVIDQGTLLDRIDYNVEQMSTEVKGAVEELKTATRYQRRSGKCQLIFLLVLLIFGCLIVIAYKPRRSSLPPPAAADSLPTLIDGAEAAETEPANSVEEIANELTKELDGRGWLPRQAEAVAGRTSTDGGVVGTASAQKDWATGGSRRQLWWPMRPVQCEEEQQDKSSEKVKEDEKSLFRSITSLSLPSVPSVPLPSLSLPELTALLASWSASLTSLTTTLQKLQTELSRGPDSTYGRIVAAGKDSAVHPELEWDAEVRLGTDLALQERAYLRNRREAMRGAFAKLMDVPLEEVDVRDLPVVAFAASGGGYRAMLNTLSSLSAARSSGILDCTTYIAGVSGSCWALNTLMSVGGASLPWTLQHLRQRIKEPFLTPETFVHLLDTDRESSVSLLSGAILKNASKNGEVSLVDVYGTLVSTRLFVLSESPPFPPAPVPLSLETLKTSSQRRFVDDGQAPLPIYCTIRHDLPPDDVIKQKEQEGMSGKEILAEGKWHWFEITPYEVGCDQLGAFIPTWALGRHFDAGKSVERVPELSLTILSGIFASAFTATLLNYWVELKPLLANLPFSGTINEFITSNAHKLDAIHPFPPAELPNFLKGLAGNLREGVPDSITNLETLGFMDAGANMNLPYVPLMRRQCDIVIALDASADSQDLWFTRAAEYAQAYATSPADEGGGSRWPGVDAATLFPRRGAEEGDGERAAEKVDEAKKQEGEVLDRAPNGEGEEGETERTGVREKNPQPAPLGSAPTSAGAAPAGDKEEEKELGLGADAGEKPMPSSSAEGEPPLGRCSIWIGSTSPSASNTCRNDHPTVEDIVERDGIALAYIPLSAHPDPGQDGNEKEKELPFDPLEVFSTWRFDYTEEETDRLVRLAEDNFMAGEEQLKTLIKGVWMRKRKQRREEEEKERAAGRE